MAPYREIRSCNGRIKKTREPLQKAGQKWWAARKMSKNVLLPKDLLLIMDSQIFEKEAQRYTKQFLLVLGEIFLGFCFAGLKPRERHILGLCKKGFWSKMPNLIWNRVLHNPKLLIAYSLYLNSSQNFRSSRHGTPPLSSGWIIGGWLRRGGSGLPGRACVCSGGYFA